jgi:hypothetical protein
MTDLPVELNKDRKNAQVVFGGKDEFGFLSEWKRTLGDDQNPFRRDAVEFAELIEHRFAAHSSIQAYVRSVEDIGDHITNDPHSEVAAIVLLKCDWFPESSVIGISHFRRTWCNNMILDYLAVHPYIARPPAEYGYIVRGAGSALLYFLSRAAQQYSCEYIWGEATQISCGFYQKILLLDSVKDLILASKEKYIKFADGLELGWQNKPSTATTPALSIKDVYTVEAENPPLIGNKVAMFDPARQLAYHFLDLPGHIQKEIAGELGLLKEEDKDSEDDKLFRDLFRRARQQGKLADFWSAVEKQRPNGEQGKNPFATSSD